MVTKKRFADTNFADLAVESVTPEEISVQGFSCSRREFVSHLKKRVFRDCSAHLSRLWVIRSPEGELAAFITLFADKLNAKQSLLEENEGVLYKTYPAVKIGLLAVDERTADRGLGKRLVKWAVGYVAGNIAPLVGVRYITVDALTDDGWDVVDGVKKQQREPYDISGFYHGLGFDYVDPEEPPFPAEGYRSMFLDLWDTIETITATKAEMAAAAAEIEAMDRKLKEGMR